MGIVIGIGQTKPQMPYDQFYGIEWDVTVSNPKAKRIGKLELHASLPIQSLMRRCVLRDNGEVAYYLDANDSTKKEGGAPAKLDGTDGQVMVEVPAFWVKFEADGNKRRCLMSLHALPGFTKWEKLYVSAYEATVQRSTSKLSSVVNATADYRGGDNNASKDGKFNSLLGRPASNFSAVEARTYAKNRGASNWGFYAYQAHKELFWLYVVEYANFNAQEDFTASLDESGCKQGGLGAGLSNIWYWGSFNLTPVAPCGVTNPLGNASGVVSLSVRSSDGGGGQVRGYFVPSYRGVEQPFGHISKMIDGAKCIIRTNGDCDFFVADNKTAWSDSGVSGYERRGVLAPSAGYVKELLVGSAGDIAPEKVGGGSSVYFCDNFSRANKGNSDVVYIILVGGHGLANEVAGLSAFDASVLSISHSNYVGTRLCYLP